MRLFLAIFIVLLVPTMFFAYPPIIEESGGECSALAQRVEDLASQDGGGLLTVAPLYGSSSSEPSGAALARAEYPLLPTGIGCAFAFWATVVAPRAPPMPATFRATAPTEEAATPAALPFGEQQAGRFLSTIARDITPNGDPISPETTFTLPMPTVAIRVDYPDATQAVLRFQLLERGAVLAMCSAHRAPGIAWCRFAIDLRKGVYSIAFFAGNARLGEFPFTVIGR
jgi:hypothetical protein